MDGDGLHVQGPTHIMNHDDDDDDDGHLLDHTLVFYSGSNCKGNGREQERWKKSVFMDTIHRFPYKDPI